MGWSDTAGDRPMTTVGAHAMRCDAMRPSYAVIITLSINLCDQTPLYYGMLHPGHKSARATSSSITAPHICHTDTHTHTYTVKFHGKLICCFTDTQPPTHPIPRRSHTTSFSSINNIKFSISIVKLCPCEYILRLCASAATPPSPHENSTNALHENHRIHSYALCYSFDWMGEKGG